MTLFEIHIQVMEYVIFDVFPQELRIKSEVLDRKIVEVDELKSELRGGNGGAGNKDYCCSNGYKTFPEKRRGSSPKNVKPGIKPAVKQATIINRKCGASQAASQQQSSNRHSVQICQV